MTDQDLLAFDRGLEDLRDAAARANTTMSKAIVRYERMMSALEVAFSLFYGDMSAADQAKMKTAFDKLEATVALFTDGELPQPDTIVPIKRGK